MALEACAESYFNNTAADLLRITIEEFAKLRGNPTFPQKQKTEDGHWEYPEPRVIAFRWKMWELKARGFSRP